MLVAVGVSLLVVWAIGVVSPYDAGQLVHVLLLVGLMLLLIALAKARDVAVALARATDSQETTKRRV
jgi:hypothetical protein